MTDTRRKVIEIVTAVYDRESQIDEAADEIIELIRSAERGEWRRIQRMREIGAQVDPAEQ